MNEFTLWFIRPIAEMLGTLAMFISIFFIGVFVYMLFYWYTLTAKWLNNKFKNKND